MTEGEERQKVWGGMVDIYPPHSDYAQATDRYIPVNLFKAKSPIDGL
ncbi:MAG: hypothetical protein WAO76_18490 [Georgfuchsia sp.]